jgi:hypothetical protein
VAPVAPIAAGVVAMGSGLLMWTAVSYDVGVSGWSPWLSVAPAGAATLVAAAGLALRGRARWLRYAQIGLWLLALASSVYIVNACAPVTGHRPLAVARAACRGVILARSVRRPASRQPRWHLAPVLLAAALTCIAAGSGARTTPTGRTTAS